MMDCILQWCLQRERERDRECAGRETGRGREMGRVGQCVAEGREEEGKGGYTSVVPAERERERDRECAGRETGREAQRDG
jgi:hypothetical protein